MESREVIKALAALAQHSRLAIYRLLGTQGPQGASAGLLRAQSQGRFVIYSVDYQAMNALLKFLTDNCCGGNPCISVASAATSQTSTY